jgi:Tfp pilus assembly protein FimT
LRPINPILSDVIKVRVLVSIMIALAAPAVAQSGGAANPAKQGKKASERAGLSRLEAVGTSASIEAAQ